MRPPGPGPPATTSPGSRLEAAGRPGRHRARPTGGATPRRPRRRVRGSSAGTPYPDRGWSPRRTSRRSSGRERRRASPPWRSRRTRRYALDADVADHVYASSTAPVAAARSDDAAGSVDPARRLFDVTDGDRDGRRRAPSTTAFDLAALGVVRPAARAGERLLADAVDYVKQRKQFGRGSGRTRRSSTARRRPDRPRLRPAARPRRAPLGARRPASPRPRWRAGDAAYPAARTALQVHGAIGYTAEHDLSSGSSVRALVTAWGTPAYHRGRASWRARALMDSRSPRSSRSSPRPSGRCWPSTPTAGRARRDGEETGYDEELWSPLCEQIGVAALAVPEEYGGAGPHLFETAVVLEELGGCWRPLRCCTRSRPRRCSPATRGRHAAALLPRIAAGAVATVVTSRARCSTRPPTIVLVPTETTGCSRSTTPTRPDARPGHGPAPSGCGHVDADRRTVAGRSATSHAGAVAHPRSGRRCQRGLDMTVAYSKERVQFGRPIGSFQALKHRMADMLVLVEMSRSAPGLRRSRGTRRPTDGRPAPLPPSPRPGAATRSRQVAAETVQLHGGIAITWEHDAHLSSSARTRSASSSARRTSTGPRRTLSLLSAPPPSAGPARGAPPARPGAPSCSTPKPSSTVSAVAIAGENSVVDRWKSPVPGELPAAAAPAASSCPGRSRSPRLHGGCRRPPAWCRRRTRRSRRCPGRSRS